MSSPVWELFDFEYITDYFATCKICREKVICKGRTMCLTRHAKVYHRNVFEEAFQNAKPQEKPTVPAHISEGRASRKEPGLYSKVQQVPDAEMRALVDRNFSGPDIAEHFGFGVLSVYRHLAKIGISPHGFKRPGVKVARAKGYIPRKTYRRINIHKGQFFSTDQELPEMSLSDDNVLSSLSVTQIGGFYKMAKWGFVVHAGMDIFSRYLLYMKLSKNNKASTVLKLFQSSVAYKGLPARVRCHNGEENVGVDHYMDINRPNIPDRIIVQKLGFNGRFKRFWVDVTRNHLAGFIDIFTELENSGKLDRENEVDMYCLHHCFSRLIQSKLDDFRLFWNSHKLSVVGGLRPSELHLVGRVHLKNRARRDGKYYPELDQENITPVDPKREWPPTEIMNQKIVEVLAVPRLLKRAERAELCSRFDPNSITLKNCRKKYRKIRRYVYGVLASR